MPELKLTEAFSVHLRREGELWRPTVQIPRQNSVYRYRDAFDEDKAKRLADRVRQATSLNLEFWTREKFW